MNRFRSSIAALAWIASLEAHAAALAAVAPATHVSARAAARVTVLRFIEDDYARALAEAKARRVPLFIESWAPW